MMEFTYNGLVRYGFGFYNPNHAAALITMIIPVLWGLRRYFKSISMKFSVVCVEIVFYIALVLTYSRTGIGALILSAIFFYTLTHFFLKSKPVKFFRNKSVKREIMVIGGIGLFVFIAALTAGSAGRYFKWIISPDKSVTNRFTLWKGALQMVADNPNGVGTGLSGRIFTDFMQSPEASGQYRTMVNSFLTFICEQGLVAFFIIMAVVVFLTFASLKIISSSSATFKLKLAVITAIAVFFSAFVNGAFSTCFDLSVLLDLKNGAVETNNIMQTILLLFVFSAMFFLVFLSVKHRELFKLKKTIIMALMALAVICLLIFLCDLFFREKGADEVHVFTVKGKAFIKIVPFISKNESFLILPDSETAGHKKIRQFIKEKYGDVKMIFSLSSNFTYELFPENDYLVMCGKNASIDYGLKNSSSGKSKLIYYLPAFEPIVPGTRIHKVYLNEFDEYGVNFAWERKLPSEIIEYCY